MSYLTFTLTKSNIQSWQAIAKTEVLIVGNYIKVGHDTIHQFSKIKRKSPKAKK
jgi:hypothetical protein